MVLNMVVDRYWYCAFVADSSVWRLVKVLNSNFTGRLQFKVHYFSRIGGDLVAQKYLFFFAVYILR